MTKHKELKDFKIKKEWICSIYVTEKGDIICDLGKENKSIFGVMGALALAISNIAKHGYDLEIKK